MKTSPSAARQRSAPAAGGTARTPRRPPRTTFSATSLCPGARTARRCSSPRPAQPAGVAVHVQCRTACGSASLTGPASAEPAFAGCCTPANSSTAGAGTARTHLARTFTHLHTSESMRSRQCATTCWGCEAVVLQRCAGSPGLAVPKGKYGFTSGRSSPSVI